MECVVCNESVCFFYITIECRLEGRRRFGLVQTVLLSTICDV